MKTALILMDEDSLIDMFQYIFCI